MNIDTVVLVDQQDNPIGEGEKLATHQEGKLHRAVSVFLFNSQGDLLIQQRALCKYHCGGLWSNTCCGHPRPGELPLAAAGRRLFEEMGIRCPLKKTFDFIYRVELDQGLIEHEFDHVFTGQFEGEIQPNPMEVQAWKWITIAELLRDFEQNPHLYTFWFKTILNQYLNLIL